jgi:hypothetical protein
MIWKMAIILSLVFFLGAGALRAEGLNTLIEISKDQADIQKEYSEETRNYENVKRCVDSGSLVKGQDKKTIGDKFGLPVVVVGEYGTNREKWIYKPASSSFFSGPRISLFFTKTGLLDEISIGK